MSDSGDQTGQVTPQATIQCAVCQGHFAVTPEMVGTEVQCPHCMNVVVVPSVEFAVPQTDASLAADAEVPADANTNPPADSAPGSPTDSPASAKKKKRKKGSKSASTRQQADYFAPGFSPEAKPSKTPQLTGEPDGTANAINSAVKAFEPSDSESAADTLASSSPDSTEALQPVVTSSVAANQSTNEAKDDSASTAPDDLLPPTMTADLGEPPTEQVESNDHSATGANASSPVSESPQTEDVPRTADDNPDGDADVTFVAGESAPTSPETPNENSERAEKTAETENADDLLPQQAEPTTKKPRRAKKSVDELLPPGASEVPDIDERGAEDKPKKLIVIPTEDGQQIALREPTRTIGAGSKQVELRTVSDEEKKNRRQRRRIIFLVISALIMAVTFYVLLQLDMGQIYAE